MNVNWVQVVGDALFWGIWLCAVLVLVVFGFAAVHERIRVARERKWIAQEKERRQQ
jgi:hypothetical protein